MLKKFEIKDPKKLIECQSQENSFQHINVPKGWVKNILNDIAEIIMGQSPQSSFYNYRGVGFYFLQGCSEFGNKYPNPLVFCSAPIKIATKGSLLISVRAPVGDINISDREYCIGRGLAAIIPKKINNYFLYNYIKLKKSYLDRISQGSTFLAINSNDIKYFKILTPPPEEQNKIANILSTLDNVIEKTEALIEKEKKVKKGLMQDLFTRGVLPDGRLRPPVSIAPNLYKKTKIGYIPKEWEIKRIDSIVKSMIRDFGSFAMTNLIVFVENGIPFIKSEIVQDGYIDYNNIAFITESVHKLLYKSFVYKGNILFTKIGAIGRVAVYDGRFGICNSNAATAKIEINDDIANVFYVAYKLSSERVLREFSRIVISTPPRINLGDINSMIIKLPKKEEQDRIANILINNDNRIKQEEEYLKKLKKIKYGLMEDLLTGKVRVKVQ